MTTSRFLELWTDGGENNSIGSCSGEYSDTPFPWTSQSWQSKTYLLVTQDAPTRPTIRGDFTLLTETSSLAGPTDGEFFSVLAGALKGMYVEIADTSTAPTSSCVDCREMLQYSGRY